MESESEFRFHHANRKLVETLLELETCVRGNFGLNNGSNSTSSTSSNSNNNRDTTAIVNGVVGLCANNDRPLTRVLVLVLLNYIYDAYLRLVVCGRGYLVEELNFVGTLTFLWSLERAHRLNPRLISSADDVQTFSEQLDNLRRTWNIDILMPSSIAYLDSVVDSGRFATISSDADRSGTTRRRLLVNNKLLDRLKTYYNVEYESAILDHSTHYEDAYVPMYRFCDSGAVAMSLSRYIGNTMRNNVRSLYRYIAREINDPRSCPCVVLFNLFIRDHYRMYHSKSLRQSGFVHIRRSDGSPIKLSFMVIANNFPRVTNWFNLINNQLVKKTNKVQIQHLDTFVRLMSQLLKEERKKKRGSGTTTTTTTMTTTTTTTTLSVGNNSVGINSNNFTHGKRLVAPDEDDYEAATTTSSTKPPVKRTRTCRRDVVRPTLASMHESVSIQAILPRLFNSNYERCRHKRVERHYEQLRSNDENATLVRICLDCGKTVR